MTTGVRTEVHGDLVLLDRQLVDLPKMNPVLQEWYDEMSFKHLGVSLGNEEAQTYLALDCRVFGDQNGPYLVVRVPYAKRNLGLIDAEHVDVTVMPRTWRLGEKHGIICWLKEIK